MVSGLRCPQEDGDVFAAGKCQNIQRVLRLSGKQSENLGCVSYGKPSHALTYGHSMKYEQVLYWNLATDWVPNL